MKLLAIVALVGLALASRNPSWTDKDVSETYYRHGREYQYRFDGQLTAGLHLADSERAITRIQSLIALQPESESLMRLQMNEIRIATAQKNVDTRRVLSLEETEVTRLDKVSPPPCLSSTPLFRPKNVF